MCFNIIFSGVYIYFYGYIALQCSTLYFHLFIFLSLLVGERRKKSSVVSLLLTAIHILIIQCSGYVTVELLSVPVLYSLSPRLLSLSIAKQLHLIFYSSSCIPLGWAVFTYKVFMRNCMLLLK